jgi:hypothetical protein
MQRFLSYDFIMVFLYLNDIWIVGKNVYSIARLKKDLRKRFAVKDFGPAKCILSMGVERDRISNKL